MLAPSAFLASAASTRVLQDLLLPSHGVFHDQEWVNTLSFWSDKFQTTPPSDAAQFRQKAWDSAAVASITSSLVAENTDPYHKARLLALQASHSGDWLQAWPITACGLRLDDEAVRVAVGMRLGANICVPHPCPCGTLVDARGSHGLSCHRSAGRQTRHSQLNDAIHRALIRAGVPASREPTGLMQSGDRRPDGCTLIGWKSGKSLAWDVTVPNTFAPSHIPETSIGAGAAAERAAKLKSEKYIDLRHGYTFFQIAIETLGPINAEGVEFLNDLGHRLACTTGDSRERAFLYQRISIIVQRCNAISFSGTFENFLPEG